MFFHWLSDSKLGKEIVEVNALCPSFSSYGKVQELNKMMKTKNSREYYAAKRVTENNLSNWEEEGRLDLTIAMNLVYFAPYTNILKGITHNVQVEYDYDQMQTNQEIERHKKILESKNTMSMTRVLTCSTCMENHLNHVNNEMKEGTAHAFSEFQKTQMSTGWKIIFS